jgi:hypothetical protein
MADGREITSPDTTFRGELEDPLTDAELTTKYRWLAGSLLAADRVAALEDAAWGVSEAPSIAPLLRLLAAPPDRQP